MRLRRLVPLLAAAATLLAAGCASVAPPVPRAAPRSVPPAPVARAGEAESSQRTQASPGGYYLDDGPLANPPPDLDRIPEPEPRVEPLHRFANNPYSVFGQSYVPERVLGRSVSRGVASWYGRRFHGNRTASGEIYDMYQLTAAHPTLPIPSYARVTNLANGRSVLVRVNDRGPFIRGRAMDLSYAAAARLGYVDQGSADVEIESIDPTDMVSRAPEASAPPASRAPVSPLPRLPAAPPPVVVVQVPAAAMANVSTAPAPSAAPAPAIVATVTGNLPVVEERAGIFLQLGAYRSSINAESVLARMIFQLEDVERHLRIVLRNGLHRIWAGPFASRIEAEAAAARFAAFR